MTTNLTAEQGSALGLVAEGDEAIVTVTMVNGDGSVEVSTGAPDAEPVGLPPAVAAAIRPTPTGLALPA